MSKHYSPLRYPGGKSKLSDLLSKIIDSKSFGRKVVFVEPFAGGAGAALTLLMTGKVSKIIINDLDPAIFAFWKVAVNDTDKLIRKIKRTEVNISEWKKQKKIYQKKSSNTFDLAFATFFLNRTNRSGIIEGGPIGGNNQESVWKINARFNKEGLINRLEKIKEYSKYITVTNYDGVKLLEEIQKRKDIKDHFIFIDPPYIQKGQLLYLNHYKNNDHEKLSRFLNKSKLDWVMTYDDTSYVRELYSQNQIRGFKIAHTAHSRKTGKEVLISPSPIKGRIKIGA